MSRSLTIDWDALRTALGTGTLDYGQLISAATTRRLACDCKLIPVVMGSDSEPLDVGRAMRTVPRGSAGPWSPATAGVVSRVAIDHPGSVRRTGLLGDGLRRGHPPTGVQG